MVIKDYQGFKVTVDEYDKIFDIKITANNLKSDFALTINLPNKFWFTTPANQADIPYSIYFPSDYDPDLFENIDFLKFWDPFCKMINDLFLSEIEGIFLQWGEINLALSYTRDLVPILDRTIDLIKNNPLVFYKVKDERIFKKNIPEDLRCLIPLLKKWCIADDSEREHLMNETSEKQKLIKTVYPHLVRIDEFLDSFGDEPLSHEAILLGNLAELVTELS